MPQKISDPQPPRGLKVPMAVQHILVPIDFSSYADQALEYAIELAQRFQARLTLLHVVDLSPIAVGSMFAYSIEGYLQAMETEAQEHMQALLHRIQQKGLQGETVIVQGIPFQAIIDVAESQHIDLIIMGTHGRTGLTHVLMGSVAERVVRMAPCAVLVTRGRANTVDT